jgi:hypothetical protein
MVTVLLRLAPDVEDRDLEEISTQDDLKGALGGGDILLESTSQEIITRVGRLSEDLRTYSKVVISDFPHHLLLLIREIFV